MNKTKRKYKGAGCIYEGKGIENAKILILDKKLYRIDELDDGIINALKGTKSCNNYPIFINLLRFIANYKGNFDSIGSSLFEEAKKYKNTTESNSFIIYANAFVSNSSKREVKAEMIDFPSYQQKIINILGRLDEPLTVVPIDKSRYHSVIPLSDLSPRSDDTTSTIGSASSSRSTSSSRSASSRRSASSHRSASRKNPKDYQMAFTTKGDQIESKRSINPFGTPKKKVVPFEGGKSKRNNRSNNKTKRKYKK